MSMRLLLSVTGALFSVACASAPPYQGVAAPELFEIARGAFDVGDYEEAQQAFDRFLISFPSNDRAPEARMLLAEAYFSDEQYITALSEYRRFLNRFPDHASAPDAALGTCRSSAALSPNVQRDQSYTAEAENVCSNVAVDYPGTRAADEARETAGQMRHKLARKLHEIADYYFRRKFYDSAIIYWEMIEEQYADTELAPTALLGIMKAYEEIGYDDLVEEARQKILDVYPDSEEARGLGSNASALAAPSGGVR